MTDNNRVHVIVTGKVQGVFFRAFTRDEAVRLGLSGWVRNRPNGSVEAIVEGFSQMKADLDTEKRSMQRIWKQREKQIEKVINNTIDMYGSMKGIAGNAIQTVKALELSIEDDNTN